MDDAGIDDLCERINVKPAPSTVNQDLLTALIDCVEDLEDWMRDHDEHPDEPFTATVRAVANGRAAIAKAEEA